ncbi:LPS export ABC transporter permease LptF [Desulfovibrio sp. OttesenSCG-928-F07]|nr:LPS export ABC transporter permease LptF [Desulfovibrio sp. OttesenSCG-928-F07]
MLNILPFNTLHRKVMAEIVRTFLLCAVFLLTLLLLGQGVRMRELLVGLNLGFGDFIMVLFFMSPIFMLLVIPLSCMLSVFLTILRMSSDRELVAIKAGGISIVQLLPAPIWFSIFCCAITLSISFFGISWGTEQFRTTVLQMAREKAQVNLQPGVFNQDINDLTMFARQVDPQTKEMRQVIVEDRSLGAGNRITILAPNGIIITDNKKGELIFKLYNGRIYKLDKENVSVLNFNDYSIRVSLEKLFKNVPLGEVKPKEMSWQELQEARAKQGTGRIGRDARKVRIEIQKRISLPISCIVLAFFAIPLAAGFEGAKRQLGLVIVLIAFLLYYSLYSLGITFGESGMVHPVIAMWTSNVVFLIVGCIGLLLASREGTPDISALLTPLKKTLGKKGKAA